MRTQQQAFKAYYASMTDSELLATAENRESFIPIAQNAMNEELLRRRQLGAPADPRAKTDQPPAPPADPRKPPVLAMAHGAHVGATEDQVSMVGTVPERVNKHGEKIEDMAGTGEHDSLGG